MSQARTKRSAAQEKLDDGIDPGAALVKERHDARVAETIEQLKDDYLKRAAPPGSKDEIKRILEKNVVPAWRGRKVRDITKADIVSVLGKIEDRGALIMANRTHSSIRSLFKFAVGQGVIENTPFVEIRRPLKNLA